MRHLRRTKRRATLALALLALACGNAATQGATPATQGAVEPVSRPYAWRNVAVGAGGYVPGLVFSRVERGLAYLRTDIGGAYRWDAGSGRWLPLQDAMSEGSYFGIESIALDPVDAGTVYAAAGMYRRKDHAAILSSSDRGAHWQVNPVAFRMGGNEEGRGLGERLAVDPNDNNTLYFGSRYDGLMRSRDRGRSWARVNAFPLRGRAPPAQGPAGAGLSFVLIDARSGAPGKGSRTLYVGSADPGEQHLFRSNDGGASWSAIPGGPDASLLPLQAQLDARGFLYVTYGDGIGPNGIQRGAVQRLEPASQAWTDITPTRHDAEQEGGFMGLALDRQHGGTLLVASVDRWKKGDRLWRSTDDGATWTDLTQPATQDYRPTPYLAIGERPVGFNHWMTAVAIDPFDSSHVAYATGATIYATNAATKADGRNTTPWSTWIAGIEETAVIALASPPAGPPLVSALGDIGGFVHDDFAASPASAFQDPVFSTTRFLDFAGRAPEVFVRAGEPRDHEPSTSATLAWSGDSGRHWTPLRAPPLRWRDKQGQVVEQRFDLDGRTPMAVSADGKTFIVMTPVPLLTRDRGGSWTTVKGLPGYLRLVADRVDPDRWYAIDFAQSTLYASSDGGATFAAVAAHGLPASLAADEPKNNWMAWPLIAAPALAGELWYLSQGRLYHSTDSGQDFAQVQTQLAVSALSFGRSPPSRTNPALYAIGDSSGVTAIWRSDDDGQHWQRLTDGQHEYGRNFRCLSGDARVYGRVYVGTDGRGILVGEPAPATDAGADAGAAAPIANE